MITHLVVVETPSAVVEICHIVAQVVVHKQRLAPTPRVHARQITQTVPIRVVADTVNVVVTHHRVDNEAILEAIPIPQIRLIWGGYE